MLFIDLKSLDALTEKERGHIMLAIVSGYALERAQKFERAVALLLSMCREDLDVEDYEGWRAEYDRLSSVRLARLLEQCVSRGLIDAELAELLEKAKEWRNEFVHGFFVDNDLHSRRGFSRAMAKAQGSHTMFDQAQQALAGEFLAVATRLGYTPAEMATVQATIKSWDQDWSG